MQRKKFIASAALSVTAFGALTATASAQEMLTGDTRLACEAILCLSSGTQPGECTPSLSRYFSISHRKLSDTIRGRINFLNLCPAANQTPQMAALVNAQANGAGRCDAASLNAAGRSWTGLDEGVVYISNQMPSYCTAYTSNAYTDFSGAVPRYVGIPERAGYWVEGRDYERALAEYNARIQAEDEERQRASWGGGSN
ncbi:MAG: TrbM family protein [Arthrobacter sp.]|nr:TrbM family protein [Arthrobacter sp.]